MTQTELTDQSELKDEDKVLATVKKHYESIKGLRQEIDWQIYKNEAYYRGKHFVQWNPATRSLEEPPAKRGEVRLPFPISKDIIQRTLLEVTKNKPKFSVIPENTEDEEVKRARLSNQLLEALFEKQRLGKKIKQVVLHGLKTSVGIWEVLWNDELGEDGDVQVRIVDPTDFYIGPNYESPEDAPVVIKIIRKDLGYLLSSDLYKKLRPKWTKDLQPDNKVTDNNYREMVLNTTYGNAGDMDNLPTPQGSVLLAECYLKYYPAGETKPKYRIVTYAVKQGVLLRNEDTDLERPPFFVYHTDQNPGEFYGEGWLKHLVPMNKGYDLLANKLLAYYHKLIGGKYLVDLGADPSAVTNSAGEFIEVNPGRRFEPLPIPPIPPASYDMLEVFHRAAQDTGGIHEASLGRVPKGVESARGLEALVQGDTNQKSDLKENLDDFLEEVGEYMLELISDNYTTSRLVSVYNDKGDLEQFTAIGQNAAPEQQEQMDAVIKPRNDVKVTTGSKLADTPEARQQKLIELFSMNLVGKEEVLKEFGYGNIADIIERTEEQAKKVMEMKEKKPEPRDTRDYVNTKLSDMAPSERAQYLDSIGIQPEQDPSQVPGAVQAQQALTEQKAQMDLENTMVKQGQQSEVSLAQAEQESLNPNLAGGAVDGTQQALMDALQQQEQLSQGEQDPNA